MELIEKVAAGASGVVWRGTFEGSPVALKQFFSIMMDPTIIAELRREAALLAQLRHPSVVTFFGVTNSNNGDLYDKLARASPSPSRLLLSHVAAWFVRGLHCGCVPCHDSQVHCDGVVPR